MDSFDSLKYLPLYGARGNELDFLRIVICGNYKSINFINYDDDGCALAMGLQKTWNTDNGISGFQF